MKETNKDACKLATKKFKSQTWWAEEDPAVDREM